MFYAYVLRSVCSGRLYIGSSHDVSERLRRHNENKEKATRKRGPWVVIKTQGFATRAEAVGLEMQLKKWKNKIRILEWIRRNE
jgi:putative endonuclease